jgi:hypothetical protein
MVDQRTDLAKEDRDMVLSIFDDERPVPSAMNGRWGESAGEHRKQGHLTNSVSHKFIKKITQKEGK